jgi:hypothetical protein
MSLLVKKFSFDDGSDFVDKARSEKLFLTSTSGTIVSASSWTTEL